MNKPLNFKHISVHELPEESPGFLLWHVSMRWRSSIEQVLKSFDLTHPQFVMLATTGWLTRAGERVNQITVARMAGLDANTASQVLRSLEAKGLIARSQTRDERSKNPVLTTAGAERLAVALPAVEQADALFFNVLSETELAYLTTFFRKLMRSGISSQ